MWRLLEKKSGISYEKGDYVLEKVSDLEKLAPYLYPKIEGDWKIVLIGLSLKENIDAYTHIEIPKSVEIVSYVAKDVLQKMSVMYPELKVKQKSSRELYKDLIADIPKLMTSKALKELYNRFNGNINKIAEIVPEMVKNSEGRDVIDIKDVDAVAPRVDVVYAKDVLLAFLLSNCELIPKRGHRLSTYRWKKPNELLEKLITDLGRNYSFYAIRKQVMYLMNQKIKYMHGEDYKEIAVQFIDTYQITELVMGFQMYGSGALEVLLWNIERRVNNDSIFDGKVITYSE